MVDEPPLVGYLGIRACKAATGEDKPTGADNGSFFVTHDPPDPSLMK
jgi:hypothetical protein